MENKESKFFQNVTHLSFKDEKEYRDYMARAKEDEINYYRNCLITLFRAKLISKRYFHKCLEKLQVYANEYGIYYYQPEEINKSFGIEYFRKLLNFYYKFKMWLKSD